MISNFIYIYIYREREIERERETHTHTHMCVYRYYSAWQWATGPSTCGRMAWRAPCWDRSLLYRLGHFMSCRVVPCHIGLDWIVFHYMYYVLYHVTRSNTGPFEAHGGRAGLLPLQPLLRGEAGDAVFVPYVTSCIVAIFYPFGQFCEIIIFFLSLQKQPKESPKSISEGGRLWQVWVVKNVH